MFYIYEEVLGMRVVRVKNITTAQCAADLAERIIPKNNGRISWDKEVAREVEAPVINNNSNACDFIAALLAEFGVYS